MQASDQTKRAAFSCFTNEQVVRAGSAAKATMIWRRQSQDHFRRRLDGVSFLLISGSSLCLLLGGCSTSPSFLPGKAASSQTPQTNGQSNFTVQTKSSIALPASGIINTIAGTGSAGYSGDGGAATSAKINNPRGAAIDGSGNVYIVDYSNSRIRKITASTALVSTVVGNGTAGYAGDGGQATSAEVNQPTWATLDSAGNLYIADNSNNRIRKMTPSGAISTIAGNGTAGFQGDGGAATSAELNGPSGVAVDAAGNVYIADSLNNRVREVSASTGNISTIAGTGTAGYSGDGAAATSAKLNSPSRIATDSSANIYIADTNNNRVRKVTASTGVITTVAGNGTAGYSGDGAAATSAMINGPRGIAVDNAGNIYIADANNNRIREVAASTGFISTFAGNGTAGFSGDGGPATSAELNGPFGVGLDSAGNVYIADTSNQRIRVVGTLITTASVSVSCSPASVTYGQWASCSATVSGSSPTGTVNFLINGTALASCTLSNGRCSVGPSISPFSAGSYTITGNYSGDSNNTSASGSTSLTIVPATPTISIANIPSAPTLGGFFVVSYSYSGNGSPTETAASSTGSVCTVSGNTVTFVAVGTCTLTASVSATSNFTSAIGNPQSFSVGAATPIVLPPSGIINTIVGSSSGGYLGDGGGALNAGLNRPYGVAVDPAGNVYLSDLGNSVIRKVVASTGIISTVAGNGTQGYAGDGGKATNAEFSNPQGIAVDSHGNIYIADATNNRIREVNVSNGNITTVAGGGSGCAQQTDTVGDGCTATNAILNGPSGIAVDSSGNIFISDRNNSRIREVSASTNVISTVAGNGTAYFAGDNGPATSAELFVPEGVAVDSAGNIYIADYNNNRIRKVTASTGIITTVAGNGFGEFGYACNYAGDNGPATSAQICSPSDVVLDSAGNIYIVDFMNQRIREVSASTGIISTVAGNGTAGFSGDGGPAINAEINWANTIALDSAGNLYIADTVNNRIRAVGALKTTASVSVSCSPTVIVTGSSTTCTATVTGSSPTGTVAFTVTSSPFGTCTLSSGSCSVSGFSSLATGSYTITGSYSGDSKNTSASGTASLTVVQSPPTISINNIPSSPTYGGFFTATYSYSGTGTPSASATSSTTGVCTASGSFVTFVGTGTCTLTAYAAPNMNNPAANGSPQSFTVGAAQPLVIPPSGIINTIAGNGTGAYAGDGGFAIPAEIFNPRGVAVDSAGNVYLTDVGNNRIRKLTASTGIISTIAGTGTAGYSGDGGPATSAQINFPIGIVLDSAGNIYFADYNNNRIRKIAASTGIITTYAGNGTAGYLGDGGQATNAELNLPDALAIDSSGNIYVMEYGNQRIRKIASNGVISTYAGNGTAGFSGDGGPATSAEINSPNGLAVDSAGNLYIGDTANSRVRKVTASTGVITTFAGNGTKGYSGDGGPATSAKIASPAGVAVDGAGNVYVEDFGNSDIREISASNGVISTIAGNGTQGFSGDGGPAINAELNFPIGIALDIARNIYIADLNNNRIRAIGALSAPSFTVPVQGQIVVDVIASGSLSSPFNNTLSGGFNAPITLNTTISQPGLTATFSPNPTPAPGSGTYTGTISATSTVPGGLYPVVFTGTGGGYTNSTTWNIYVTNFSVSASPTSVSVAPSSSGTTAVTVNNSFATQSATPISLSASGLPTGVTVSFSPSTVAPNAITNSVLTFNVSSTTAAGTYPIIVSGTMVSGSTTLVQSTTVNLTVTSGTVYDTGSVVLTVSEGNTVYSDTVNYGASSTPETIAANLAAGSIPNVNLTAAGGTVYMATTTTGSTSDYTYSLSSTSTAGFAQPSFAFPPIPTTPFTGGGGTTTGGTSLYSYSIQYDAAGDVLSYSDSSAATSTGNIMGAWSFSYDSLHRVQTGRQSNWVSGTANQPFYCWSYDPFGNRLQQLGSSLATSGGGTNTCEAPTNAYTSITTATLIAGNNQIYTASTSNTTSGGQTTIGATYAYDANGNVTNDGKNTYLYDAEGHICASAFTPVGGMTVMTGYLYDADGTRVAKGTITSMSCDPTVNGFQTNSDYVIGPGGEQLTEMGSDGKGGMTWAHSNVWAAGQLIASFDKDDTAGPHYMLNDWLGSRRVQANSAGVYEQSCQSLPFGDGLNCTGNALTPTEHHFTGKERDAETGNDYFEARYYASSAGRFMSPDPLMASARQVDPQTWNRYMYVRNNPLRMIDPTGMAEETAGQCANDKKCVAIDLHVIWDRHGNQGGELTEKQKSAFISGYLQQAKDKFGTAHIHFNVTFGEGEKSAATADAMGLKEGALNIVVTDKEYTDNSAFEHGYAISWVNPHLGSSAMNEEIGHQFAGDTRGASDWLINHAGKGGAMVLDGFADTRTDIMMKFLSDDCCLLVRPVYWRGTVAGVSATFVHPGADFLNSGARDLQKAMTPTTK